MKKIILLCASLAMVLCLQAQASHKFLKKQMNKHHDCKSVAITNKNGDAMLYGSSCWEAINCPVEFSRLLFELSEWDIEIHDIHLSELGRWYILYGNNEVYSNLLYENLELQISRYQQENEKISTVTYNDSGDWIVITTNRFSASSDQLVGWLEDGCGKYGQLWTACITEDAAIAVYELGFKYWGNIPSDLMTTIRQCKSDVDMVKIAGDAWFFRCTDGYWRSNF